MNKDKFPYCAIFFEELPENREEFFIEVIGKLQLNCKVRISTALDPETRSLIIEQAKKAITENFKFKFYGEIYELTIRILNKFLLVTHPSAWTEKHSEIEKDLNEILKIIK